MQDPEQSADYYLNLKIGDFLIHQIKIDQENTMHFRLALDFLRSLD